MPKTTTIQSSIILTFPSHHHFARSIPRSICLRQLHSTPTHYAIRRTNEWSRRARRLDFKISRHSPAVTPSSLQTPPWRQQEKDADTEHGAASRKKSPQSPAAQKKKALEDVGKNLNDARQDIGLAPGTWVPATGENRKILWRKLVSSEPRPALRYWYSQGRNAFNNKLLQIYIRWTVFGSQWPYFNRLNRATARKAMHINKSEIIQTASDKQSQLYNAFAEARITDIEKLGLEGLAESMRNRISRRHRDDVLRWSRKAGSLKGKYLGFKQVETGLKLKGKPLYLQQVLVQLQSTQQLTRGRRQVDKEWTDVQVAAGDNIVWDTRNVTTRENVVEYLVLQRRLMSLEPDEWKAWGFVDETTLDNYKTTAVKHMEDRDGLKEGNIFSRLWSRITEPITSRFLT